MTWKQLFSSWAMSKSVKASEFYFWFFWIFLYAMSVISTDLTYVLVPTDASPIRISWNPCWYAMTRCFSFHMSHSSSFLKYNRTQIAFVPSLYVSLTFCNSSSALLTGVREISHYITCCKLSAIYQTRLWFNFLVLYSFSVISGHMSVTWL